MGTDRVRSGYRRRSLKISSRDEQDLADVLAGLHQPMGIGGLGQRKLPVNKWPQFASGPERPDLLLQGGDDRGLLLDGARAQGRAGHRQMLALNKAEIGLD